MPLSRTASTCTALASAGLTAPMAAARSIAPATSCKLLWLSVKYFRLIATPSLGSPSQSVRKQLFAARVAWSNADNAVQIHGGNGYAIEYPISRVLCDARILNIFEGAAEIQAQVIARRLLDGSN